MCGFEDIGRIHRNDVACVVPADIVSNPAQVPGQEIPLELIPIDCRDRPVEIVAAFPQGVVDDLREIGVVLDPRFVDRFDGTVFSRCPLLQPGRGQR